MSCHRRLLLCINLKFINKLLFNKTRQNVVPWSRHEGGGAASAGVKEGQHVNDQGKRIGEK